MNLILWLVLGIVAVIFTIILLVYLTTSKKITTIFKRKNNLVYKHSFTYEHILTGLGKLENIIRVENERIYVVAINLIDIKYLKKIGVKCDLQQDNIGLQVQGFNMKLFYQRLAKDLAKETN